MLIPDRPGAGGLAVVSLKPASQRGGFLLTINQAALMSTPEKHKDPYQTVTDLIIEHLERGTVPWRCPWQRDVGIPRNFHTGKTYNGINVLLLGLRHQAPLGGSRFSKR
jgi:hypothetical protein